MSGSEVVEQILPPITQQGMLAFSNAIGGLEKTIPLALPTIFRETEFQWLGRMNIQMRYVLHTEQEYEYLAPIPLESPIKIRTQVISDREKAGIRFVALETEIFSENELRVRAYSTFVVRGPK